MLTVLALLGFMASAHGSERLLQVWTEADGLPANQVLSVDQAPNGEIWLSSLVGPVRYNGVRFQAMGPRHDTRAIRFGADEIFAVPLLRTRPLWSVGRGAVEREGLPLIGVRAAWAEGGRLWVAQDAAVHLRDQGVWTTVLETSEFVQVLERVDGKLLALGDEGVWQLAPGPVQKLSDRAHVRAWTPFAGGVLASDLEGRLVWIREGQEELLASELGYPGNIAIRGATAWAVFERGLVRVDPSGAAERVDLERLGRLATVRVDQEGSLWVAGNRGVGRLSEPETTLWTLADGLPFTPVSRLVPTEDHLWVLTNGEAVSFNRRTGAVSEPGAARKSLGLCRGADGVTWSGGVMVLAPFGRVFVKDPGPDETRYPLEREDYQGCAVTDGQVWLASTEAVYRAGDPPERAAELPPAPERGGPRSFLQGPEGRWWWHNGSQVCSVSGAAGVVAQDWSCTEAPGPVHGLAWTDAATFAAGDGALYRAVEGAWSVAMTGLDRDLKLATSPRGGIWLLQVGSLSRVDRDGVVLERIGPAHGVLDGSPTALLEEADGTVWIGSRTGLTRVPASARGKWAAAPTVALVDVSVDGEPRALTSGFSLPYASNRVSVEVAALTYRDPDSVRYRIEVNGRPEPVAAENSFRFLGLSPGPYELTVQASVDGTRWSEVPAVLRFEVARPVWQQWWAIALYIAALLAVLLAVHRARVAHLIGLERQRARIALDLHDEVGSGLGSIGLIAGVMARNEAAGPGARTIAETSAELGAALTDIVWALRPESERPEELMAFLTERGTALCAAMQLRVEQPGSWPSTTLSLPVRRNLSAIALEAMHNAAKYSRGSEVVLGLEPGRPLWRLWVHDDGVGIDPDAPVRPGGGSGMAGMRARAADISAELEVHSGAQGTRVEVRFRPGATDRRIR